jgi:hypothetical protein
MTKLAAYGCGAGSGSTIADDSGNGRTLTVGSGSYTASGHTGPGFQNTGGTASTGASGTVSAVSGSTCTIMAWVKPSALPANGVHLISGSMQAGGSTDFAIYTQRGDFGTHNVLQGNARIGGGLVAANGAALTVGTWAHVALTFDGTNLKLYKDGSLVATVSNTGSLANTATLYVAGMAAAGTSAVTVDDVRYFNTDESANIATWMNTPEGASGNNTSLNRVIETGTLSAFAHVHANTLARVTETGTLTAFNRSHPRSLTRVTETGTLASFVRSEAQALTRVSESATLASFTRSKAAVLGRVVESGTLVALARSHSGSLTRTTETGALSALARSESSALPRVTETDTVVALTRSSGHTFSPVTETAMGRPFNRAHGLNRIIEAVTLTPPVRGTAHTLPRITETGTTASFAWTRVASLPRVLETSMFTALARTHTHSVGRVGDTGSVVAPTRQHSFQLVRVIETGTIRAPARSGDVSRDLLLYVSAAEPRWRVTAIPLSRWSAEPIGPRWTAS